MTLLAEHRELLLWVGAWGCASVAFLFWWGLHQARRRDAQEQAARRDAQLERWLASFRRSPVRPCQCDDDAVGERGA